MHEPVGKDVFTLGFVHGKRPADAAYAYIVLPGKATIADMQAYAAHVPVEILSNTSDVQAVRHSALDLLQVVFYAPGRVTCDGFTVEADRPCALMLKGLGTNVLMLHISDPGQTMQPICVSVSKGRKAYWTVNHRPSADPVYAGATSAYRFTR